MLCQNDCQRLEAENTLRIHKNHRRHILYPIYRFQRAKKYLNSLRWRIWGTAGSRTWTGTMLPPRDFKSLASAYSAMPATGFVVTASSKVSYLMSHFTTMDGGGFEPPKQFAADLQSVPFGHSGIHPYHKASALTMWNFSICHLKMQALCQRTSVLKMIKFISADKKLMISDTKVSDRIPLNFFVFDSMVDSTGRNRLLQPCMVSPFQRNPCIQDTISEFF